MKKAVSLCLVVCFLVCLFPLQTSASTAINLLRINYSSGSESISFQFGSNSIDGVVRQIIPFTEEEIREIVDKVLREMKLTELEIAEMQKKVEKAKQASEFTKEDVAQVKENLVKAAGVVPGADKVAEAIHFIDKYLSKSSWDDKGSSSADMLEKATKGWVEETASEFLKDKAEELGDEDYANKVLGTYNLMNAVIDAADMMAEEHARTKQRWKDIADGANAKRTLDKFYNRLQSWIDSYKHDSDQKGWVIDFNQGMDGRNFTFFGIDSNYQTWTLDMLMNQESTDENGSAAGVYKGFFTITADHEMGEFCRRAHEVLNHIPEFSGPINEASEVASAKLETISPGHAIISRTISGSCEATIHASGKIDFSMNVESDETLVDISGIEVLFKVTPNIPISGESAEIGFNLKMYAQEENLMLNGFQGFVSASGTIDYNNKQSSGGEFSAGWDKSIWSTWDGTEKTLVKN